MNSPKIFAVGLGLKTTNTKGETLEVYYHKAFVRSQNNSELVDDFVRLCSENIGYPGGNTTLSVNDYTLENLLEIFAKHEGTSSFLKGSENAHNRIVITILETNSTAQNVEEVYLKLSLLSHRAVKPHEQNLDGIFGILPNIAWTNEGAIDLEELPARQLQARAEGRVLSVSSVDKFPKMTDYVVPSGVRIADTARVRLGAYIGKGTTIMHEGFVNFNAGTLGVSMIEGRISAGVVVGDGSDLGGGCSTMGTLSGGNDIIISVGEKCLIGANGGTGIPLGDRCTVEAGLYITAGTKVLMLDTEGGIYGQQKARDLAGKDDLLFRRDSESGQVVCLTNEKPIKLNHELHNNN
ncbi:2,3,4,5-tetrahydropyridine-2,6-dicarboxylate N-succinyltransferase [Candidatus Gracilibacteria bacterium 28_42_T64]|nr:2,3,4,5-tetrahydropyridine-2,6-dicarboxylate N-succinyltransferase [Candidatus Gracilibacteria bacterium 28_42_T64]